MYLRYPGNPEGKGGMPVAIRYGRQNNATNGPGRNPDTLWQPAPSKNRKQGIPCVDARAAFSNKILARFSKASTKTRCGPKVLHSPAALSGPSRCSRHFHPSPPKTTPSLQVRFHHKRPDLHRRGYIVRLWCYCASFYPWFWHCQWDGLKGILSWLATCLASPPSCPPRKSLAPSDP